MAHRAARRGRTYSPRDHELASFGQRWHACSRDDDPSEVDRPSRIDGEPPDRARSYPTPPADGSRQAVAVPGWDGPCAADLACRYAGRPGIRGQALVEFALVAPVMLFTILGGIEAGMLVVAKADQDRRTAVVATWAGTHPGDESWHAIAADQLAGCSVTEAGDGPDLVTIDATCEYHPVATRGLWDGLPVSSSASAVLAATASPEPSASVVP
jgi:hypothetical protein